MSKIIKIRQRSIPQLIGNSMSGCFFSETRCTTELVGLKLESINKTHINEMLSAEMSGVNPLRV